MIRVILWWSGTQTSMKPTCQQREGTQRCNPILETWANFYNHPFLIIIVRDFSTPAALLSPSQAAMGHSWSKWEGGSVPRQCRYSRSNAIGRRLDLMLFCSLLSLLLHLDRGSLAWLIQKLYQALYDNCVGGHHMEMVVYEQAEAMSC